MLDDFSTVSWTGSRSQKTLKVDWFFDIVILQIELHLLAVHPGWAVLDNTMQSEIQPMRVLFKIVYVPPHKDWRNAES